MIKFIQGAQDTKGLVQADLYKVVDSERVVALASTRQEALDAQEILFDLKGGTYHIAPPLAESN